MQVLMYLQQLELQVQDKLKVEELLLVFMVDFLKGMFLALIQQIDQMLMVFMLRLKMTPIQLLQMPMQLGQL